MQRISAEFDRREAEEIKDRLAAAEEKKKEREDGIKVIEEKLVSEHCVCVCVRCVCALHDTHHRMHCLPHLSGS